MATAYSSQDLYELVDLGYEKDLCAKALNECKGDVQQAALWLTENSESPGTSDMEDDADGGDITDRKRKPQNGSNGLNTPPKKKPEPLNGDTVKLENDVKEKMAVISPKNQVKTVSFHGFRKDDDQQKERFQTLINLFPDADPDFLFGKAVEFNGKDDFMQFWIQDVMDKNEHMNWPSREDRDRKLKDIENNIKQIEELDLIEIQKAGINGLEYCPFCPFAKMAEGPKCQKVSGRGDFVCESPDCGKRSCRNCKKISHAPKSCDELRDDKTTSSNIQLFGQNVNIKVKEDVQYETTIVRPGRIINFEDPLEMQARMIEGHFVRMSRLSNGQPQSAYMHNKIESIDFISNYYLQNKFDAKRSEFRRLNIPDDIVLMFHGTRENFVDTICKYNLSIIRRAAHGGGYYFSEFPEISLGYGPVLIVFKTLPGKEYIGSDMNKHVGENAQFQSKKVAGAGFDSNHAWIQVIANNEQFVPYCIIRLTANNPNQRPAYNYTYNPLQGTSATSRPSTTSAPTASSSAAMTTSVKMTSGPSNTNSTPSSGGGIFSAFSKLLPGAKPQPPQTFIGKVTKLPKNSPWIGYGLVDDKISYKVSVIQGDDVPNVGDTVEVDAAPSTTNAHNFMEATRVVLKYRLGKGPNGKNDNMLVGRVSMVPSNPPGYGLIENKFRYNIPDIQGWLPKEGDTVEFKVTPSEKDPDIWKATNVMLKKRKE